MNDLEYTGHKLMETIPTYTRISWNSLELCDYSCWYCYLGQRKRSHLVTNDEFNNFLENIKLNFSNREYIKFVITGGEPTYYNYKLFDYIDGLYSINNIKEIIIHTNFNKSLEWWKIFQNKYKNKKIEINASCHLEYINSNEKINDYINKMKFLYDNEINVFSWIMIEPNNKDLALNIRDRIDNIMPGKANFKFVQHPTTLVFYEQNKQIVHKDKKNVVIKFKNKEKEYLNADELIIQKFNKFKSCVCSRGINQIAIDAYGAIYTSECQWVLDRTPEVPAPGFYSPNLKLNFKPTYCKRTFCGHPSDIYIPKYNFEYYLKHLKEID